MIPRTIHYCWYGGKPMAPMLQECLESWKRHLPDYQTVCWDETNSPLEACPFVREAFRLKKWAFVSDYVRIHALHECGGVYLDTDMLVLKPLDPLLSHRAFAGFQDQREVNMAIFGAEHHHPFVTACLRWYQSAAFDPQKPPIIPEVISMLFRNHGLTTNARQSVCDVDLYPSEYFYPWPFVGYKDNPEFRSYIKPESFAVHLWNHSWQAPLPLKTRVVRFVKPFVPAFAKRFLHRCRVS